jgi:hypothetical protein
MEDTTESEPREVEAAKFNLNYVQVSEIYSFHEDFLGHCILV